MLCRLIKLLTFSIITLQTKAEYNIDILEVEWNVTTENNVEMEFEISRPSRGVFGLSGSCDFKEDIDTNNCWTLINVYYSANGISYMLSPYRVKPTVCTDGINFAYKNYLMVTVMGCCENALVIKDVFVSPLKKRRVVCKDCLYSNDNLPSHMRKGYYKVEILAKGEIEFAIKLLGYLDVE